MKDFENLPIFGKISPVACQGGRITRATCACCGGAQGVRRAWRKADNSKPKKKEHRK